MSKVPVSRPAFARIGFILKKLLDARGPITAESLAREWEVSRKCIERDIETLRNMGVNIKSHMEGYACVGIWLDAEICCPLCETTIKAEIVQPALSQKKRKELGLK